MILAFCLAYVSAQGLALQHGRLCHKSDLLQRAYLKGSRHGVKHCWLEGVGKTDDCSYLKNRELSNDDGGSENVAKNIKFA